jgi:hypothetical protein
MLVFVPGVKALLVTWGEFIVEQEIARICGVQIQLNLCDWY